MSHDVVMQSNPEIMQGSSASTLTPWQGRGFTRRSRTLSYHKAAFPGACLRCPPSPPAKASLSPLLWKSASRRARSCSSRNFDIFCRKEFARAWRQGRTRHARPDHALTDECKGDHITIHYMNNNDNGNDYIKSCVESNCCSCVYSASSNDCLVAGGPLFLKVQTNCSM